MRQAVSRRLGGARYGRGSLFVLLAAAGFVSPACGKKGPPLAPLHLVPVSPTGLSAQLTGADVKLQLIVPTRNQNGAGRVDLDRLEVYAVTIGPGAPAPANRDLLVPARLVGTIPVEPPPLEGAEAPPDAPADARPSPGDTTIFTERLTEEKLKPVVFGDQTDVAPVTVAAQTATPAPALPTYSIRIYAVRGVTRGRRPGQPSARVEVPLVPPPLPPSSVTASAVETAIALGWTAPSAAAAGAAIAFNVYQRGKPAALNAEPLTAPAFDRPGVAFGAEECFEVRSVITVAGVAVESDPSTAACITPVDTFAPAAPKGLTTVPAPGVINLLWDANGEADLAGYVVLRGEAPGGTLQPLTPQPLPGTTFEDRTVQPGVRYIYAIVAVDKATPPNVSAPSARQEETAR